MRSIAGAEPGVKVQCPPPDLKLLKLLRDKSAAVVIWIESSAILG